MRSNGAVHISNDTFAASTRDHTNGVFLVTSKIVEGRVCHRPLERHVCFGHCGDREEGKQKDSQYSFHASSDGSRVVSISANGSKHYCIGVEDGRVCEFTVQHPVVSVGWHPVSKSLLLLLLSGGKLLLLNTDKVTLGVGFQGDKCVCLHSLVATCRQGSGKRDSQETAKAGTLVKAPFNLNRCGLSTPDPTSEGTVSKKLHGTIEGMRSGLGGQVQEVVTKNRRGKKGIIKRGESANERYALAQIDAAQSPRVDGCSDIVGMCIIPPSRSLPVMLVLLCRNGDVFSVKLNKDGMPASLSKEYDGSVGAAFGEAQDMQMDSVLRPCVHYLVRGDSSSCALAGVPLAVGTTLLDEDVGLRIIYVMYSSGTLGGYLFDEPDVLCRDPMRQQVDVSVVLGAAVPCDHRLLHDHVNACRLVSIHSCGNATLIRYGDEVYLCVWPVWSRAAAGWVYRTENTEGFQRLPTIARDAKVPEPVALRVPYSTHGANIAVGVNDILIFPEMTETAAMCDFEKKVTIVKILSLVLIAIYARSEKFVLAPDSTEDAVDEGNDNEVDGSKSKGGNVVQTSLEELLGLIPTLCRQWLCGYPREVVDSSTAAVAKGVHNMHMRFRERQTKQLEREQRLWKRVEALQQKRDEVADAVAESTDTLCDAIVHRGGVSELYAANKRMGKIHEILSTLNTEVERRRKEKSKV